MPLSFSRTSFKEFLFFLLFCLSLLGFNVGLEFKAYLNFKEQGHYFLPQALVEQSYEKTRPSGKSYRVLRLKADDFYFYTTSYKDLNLSRGDLLSLKIITNDIGFRDYLAKIFYAPGYDLTPLGQREDGLIARYFLSQHSEGKAREFYAALFFAQPISKELRQDINHYGIAHLIAISGYHIGLLFALIFFSLAPFYSFFQKRLFPHRNARLDLSLLIFALLLAYAYLIGFVPSFIRSLIMAFFGFYLLMKNVKILSFFSLFLCVCLCIGLFPRLLFSVGFFFSVLGVFYIFLYLHHFARFFHPIIKLILLNVWTFLAMVLPVLYFFPLLSFQQLFGIPLSFAFVLFYPVVLFLHLIHAGSLLDPLLLEFFAFKFASIDFKLPAWALWGYLLLSLLSVRFRALALFCPTLNLIPFFFI